MKTPSKPIKEFRNKYYYGFVLIMCFVTFLTDFSYFNSTWWKALLLAISCGSIYALGYMEGNKITEYTIYINEEEQEERRNTL